MTDDEQAEALDVIFSIQREAEDYLDQAGDAAGWGHGGVPQAAAGAYRQAAQAHRRAAALLDQPTALATIRRAPMGPRGAA